MKRMVDDKEFNGVVNDVAEFKAGYTSDNASTKKIYWHTIYFKRSRIGLSYMEGYAIIINNSPTLLTITDFINILKSEGFRLIIINGLIERTPGATAPTASSLPLCEMYYYNENTFYINFRNDSNVLTRDDIIIDAEQWTITDLGANPIN